MTLYSILATALDMPDYAQKTERILRIPVLFTVIYVFGGLFAGLHFDYPQKLRYLFENYAIVRFIGLFALAYTATGEIEYTIAAMIIFSIIMNLFRNKEEREKYPLGI